VPQKKKKKKVVCWQLGDPDSRNWQVRIEALTSDRTGFKFWLYLLVAV
jgi:hypothetical protein